jgi:hypothetical protein
MTVFLAQTWAADRIAWGILVCILGAMVSAIGKQVLQWRAGWVLLIFWVSAAITLGIIYGRIPALAPVPQIAWVCALLSLLWSTVAAVTEWREGAGTPARSEPPSHLSEVLSLSALLFGVIAAIIQLVLLVMQLVSVALDLVRGFPWGGARGFSFGAEGAWTLLMLFSSCAAGWFVSKSRRLATCLLWLAVMLVAWLCLLLPAFTTKLTGGFERSAMTVWMTAGLSALLVVAVALNAHPQGARRGTPPGFVVSCAALAGCIVLLSCYHLLVPVRMGLAGFRGSLVLVTLSASGAGLGGFVLLSRSWNEGLADAALALSSFAVCGVAVLAVPFGTAPLSDLYPMVFNALIVGFAVGTGLWTYLAGVWKRQSRRASAWPTAAALWPHAKRSAFLNAALGLVAGALMTFWPRMPNVAGMDHTLGRVTAGFGAHLFLLLVMLWCSRRLARLTFNLLTILAVFTTAGFIVVRMAPFASHFE